MNHTYAEDSAVNGGQFEENHNVLHLVSKDPTAV